MTRAQTMDVLNDATDIQNEINQLLNKTRLPVYGEDWDWSEEIEWYPGDPLFEEPYSDEYLDYYGNPYTIFTTTEGGQHIRPMFEVFDNEADYHRMDCEDCDVAGGAKDESCWLCGKKFEGLWRPSAWNVWSRLGITHYDEEEFEDFDYGPWAGPRCERATWAGLPEVPDYWESYRQRLEAQIESFGDGDNLRGITNYQGYTPQQVIIDEYVSYAESDVIASARAMLIQRQYEEREVGLLTYFTTGHSPRRSREAVHSQVAAYFANAMVVDMESDIPTPTEIQSSRTERRRSTQNSYPTSRNITQERRRRNL